MGWQRPLNWRITSDRMRGVLRVFLFTICWFGFKIMLFRSLFFRRSLAATPPMLAAPASGAQSSGSLRNLADRRCRRRRRQFLLEQLEQRQLLAGDVVATVRPSWAPDWSDGMPEHLTVIADQDDFGGGVYDGWRTPLDQGFGEDNRDGEPHPPANFGVPFESEGFGRLDRNDGGFRPDNLRAAPNLRLTNTTYLRDASGVLVDSVPIGQLVAIMVQFETEGIPNGTSFDIAFSMNGVEKVREDIT